MTADAYAEAGVDIAAANRATERIKAVAARASRPEVLAGVGPFSALFRLGGGYRDPVLVSSTDGVGTKVLLARAMGVYDTVGRDLVNHCVNDILTAGAEPLFFLDYLASSSLEEDHKVAIVAGMAAACAEAGCALIGGETADMPDIYRPGDFDIAGFIVGVVERDRVIDGSRIQAGDALLMLPSSGLHTNGYSLVRTIWELGKGDDAHDRAVLDRVEPSLGESLGAALLEPHRSYLDALRPVLPHLTGIAHITGGGIPENVPRILPEGLTARFDRSAWEIPPLFRLIQQTGEVDTPTMFRTFNMGVGIVLVTPDPDAVIAALPEAKQIGAVVQRGDGAPAVVIA
jgi:phosphoribosylformylglycinamidine cyclo-ligase